MADFVRGSLAFEGTLCLEFCVAGEVRYSRLVRYLSDIADTSLSLQKVSHKEQRKKERKLRDISRMTSRKALRCEVPMQCSKDQAWHDLEMDHSSTDLLRVLR